MIRKATQDDLGEILAIYEKAGDFMRKNKNPTQRGTTYPPEALLEKDRFEHLRLDTHRDNVVMQHPAEKNGFKKCRIISSRTTRFGWLMNI